MRVYMQLEPDREKSFGTLLVKVIRLLWQSVELLDVGIVNETFHRFLGQPSAQGRSFIDFPEKDVPVDTQRSKQRKDFLRSLDSIFLDDSDQGNAENLINDILTFLQTDVS